MKKVYVGILICLVIVIVSAGCGKKYMQEADNMDWEQDKYAFPDWRVFENPFAIL